MESTPTLKVTLTLLLKITTLSLSKDKTMQILSRAKRYGPNTPTFFPPNPPFFPQSVLGFPRQIVVVYSVPTQINFTGFIKLILDLKNGGTFTGPNQSGSF